MKECSQFGSTKQKQSTLDLLIDPSSVARVRLTPSVQLINVKSSQSPDLLTCLRGGFLKIIPVAILAYPSMKTGF